MILYEDTRQQAGKHENIKEQCEALGITLIQQKLDIGDYRLEGIDNIVVDTKQDVYELANNFFDKKNFTRFQRQCKRAKKEDIKLYILVEENMTKAKLLKWKARKRSDGQRITAATGKGIYHKMQVYSIAFGVKWRFCKKTETVKKMLELFGVEND